MRKYQPDSEDEEGKIVTPLPPKRIGGLTQQQWEEVLAPTSRLRWVCLLFAGPPKWQHTEVYEPDECGYEFETEDCETTTCPQCGGDLSKADDSPEEIGS